MNLLKFSMMFAFVGMISEPLSAATFTRTTAISRGCNSTVTETHQGTEVSRFAGTTLAGLGSCNMVSQAITGAGYVGTLSTGNSFAEGALGSSEALWQSSFSITKPLGYSGGLVGIKVNSIVHGVVSSAQAVTQNSTTATALLEGFLTVFYNNGVRNDVEATTGGRAEVKAQAFPGNPATDYLELDEKLTSGWLLVDPNEEIKVRFLMRASARYSAGDYSSGSASALGMNTLSFSQQAFEFNEAGFSITNAEASVLNNQWVDPRGGSTPVVPLPAPGLLLMAAFGTLAGSRRMKRISFNA